MQIRIKKNKFVLLSFCVYKVNGPRGKRNIKDGTNSTALVEEMEQILNTSLPLKLRIKLDQTKHRINIIKLQPALRTLKVYIIEFFFFMNELIF